MEVASDRSSLHDTTGAADSAIDDGADSIRWHATLEAARRVLRFHASGFAPDLSSYPSEDREDPRVSDGAAQGGSVRSRA